MYRFLKRILDLMISGVTFILFLPFFIPICIGQLLTGEGYVFYYQKRIGFKNTNFDLWKFATMLKNSPNMGTGSITLRNDPRVTPLGKYLRASKLNELPQIINVLLGDMSIVGPRPLVDRTFKAYTDDVKQRIYDSKPGITGIGSIVFRDEELLISKSDLEPHEYYRLYVAPYKGELEMWYHKNKSLFTDIKIIFITAWVILFSKSNLVYKMFKNLPTKPSNLVANK